MLNRLIHNLVLSHEPDPHHLNHQRAVVALGAGVRGKISSRKDAKPQSRITEKNLKATRMRFEKRASRHHSRCFSWRLCVLARERFSD